MRGRPAGPFATAGPAAIVRIGNVGTVHRGTGGAPAEDGERRLSARDHAATRFSPLTQIDAGNVKGLRVSFMFSTGVLRGHEAAPLVVGATMYIVTPYPNYVYALDLARPGAPIKWQFKPEPKAASQGVACCDVVNRGLAYADGRLFFNTLDAQTIALDASSGQLNRCLHHAGEPAAVRAAVAGRAAAAGTAGSAAWRAHHGGARCHGVRGRGSRAVPAMPARPRRHALLISNGIYSKPGTR